jgi:hypothetical protein
MISKSSSFACQYQYHQAKYFPLISSCFSFDANNFIKANMLQVSGFFGSSSHLSSVTILIIAFLISFSLQKIGMKFL